MIDKYNIYLKTQKPIYFYDVCLIHQPSYNDILDFQHINGYEFDKLLLPYSLTVELYNDLEGNTAKLDDSVSNFDLICSIKDLAVYLIMSLEYFCKSKVDYKDDGFCFEGFSGKLDKDNFDEFAELVLSICGQKRRKIEKPRTFENEKQKNIWEKLQEGRKRTAKQNEVKVEDILNYCEFGGKSYIPIEEILKWSMWRIMLCYKSIVGISSYNDSFDIYLVSGEKSLIENKHWLDLLKIGYEIKE